MTDAPSAVERAARAPATVSRRTALVLGGTAVGAVSLAACAPATAPNDSGTATGDGSNRPPVGPATPTRATTLAELPVGGTLGATVAGFPVLLSRPSESDVLAFTAVCTHQGCTVAAADGGFDCPCHNSVFDTSTGEPLSGPALTALPALSVELDGDDVLVSDPSAG